MRDGPVRCAFVNHYVDWGGAEGMLLTLFEALDRQRLDPILVVPEEGRLPAGARAFEVEVVIAPVSGSVLNVTRSGASGSLGAVQGIGGLAVTVARLAKTLRSLKVDVVVTNSAKAHVYGSLAARLVRKPVVWRLHDTLDSPDFGSSLYRLMIIIARRVPRMILCVSDSCAAPLLRDGVSPERVATLYNGIDLTSFTTVPPRGPSSTFRVGSFGRLTPLKGHDVVIEAIASIAARGHDIELVIAGGPAREAPHYDEELLSLAEGKGIAERVQVVAGFPPGGLPSLLADVDVVVQASILPDSLPTTVIEAMAAGRPVIASAIGGCPELVDDERTGLLFQPADAHELANCLTTLWNDPRKLERFGNAARSDALERFGVTKFANRFCARIEEAAGSDSASG